MNSKEKKCLCKIVVLLIGSALGFVAGIAVAGFAHPIYKSEVLASWATAIGTFSAAFAAIGIALRQEKINKDAKRTEAEVKLRMAYWDLIELSGLLNDAERQLSWMINWVDSGADENKEITAFSENRKGYENSRKALEIAKTIDWDLFILRDPASAKDVVTWLLQIRLLEREVAKGPNKPVYIELRNVVARMNSVFLDLRAWML